jgi:3-hydroxybutyryl-CoA dehydrogenase
MTERDHVTVIGAGTMGRGIAQAAAEAGFRVTLYDAAPAALAAALPAIRAVLQDGVARGKVAPADRDAALSRLHAAPELPGALALAGIVIEAVPESLDLKKRIFAELGRLAPPDAVLATNTSSLPVGEIAAASGRAGRVVGMHFFNPVHIMKLLEVVRTDATGADTLERALDAGRRMGKECIVVKDSPGFATSRLGVALGLEAIRMLESEVASAQDIDTAMTLGYRHPVGPLRLTDLVGLDVRLAIARHLHATLRSETFAPPALLERMVSEGKLGRKSGEGFYRWPEGT